VCSRVSRQLLQGSVVRDALAQFDAPNFDVLPMVLLLRRLSCPCSRLGSKRGHGPRHPRLGLLQPVFGAVVDEAATTP
jgi:hypothetical protein